jgi:hypothetical protein
LQKTLESKGIELHPVGQKEEADLVFNLMDQTKEEKADGFVIKKLKEIISLESESTRGLIYGIMDIAE